MHREAQQARAWLTLARRRREKEAVTRITDPLRERIERIEKHLGITENENDRQAD